MGYSGLKCGMGSARLLYLSNTMIIILIYVCNRT